MDLQQTMKRASLFTTFRNLFFAAIAISLLSSGIIRPLLVQCTPADGHTTIELFGQDPHHHTHSKHFCEFSNDASDLSFSSCVDDCSANSACVDRFLSNTAILRTSSCQPFPKSIWGVFEKPSAQISFRTAPVSDLFPDPALQTPFHLQFKQPLLI